MYTLSSDIVWMYSCRAVRLTLATLQNDLHSCAVTAEANDLTLVVTIQACVPSRVAAEAAGQVGKQFFNSMPLPSPCRLGPAQNCEACVYSCGCSQVHKAVWSGCSSRLKYFHSSPLNWLVVLPGVLKLTWLALLSKSAASWLPPKSKLSLFKTSAPANITTVQHCRYIEQVVTNVLSDV